jgi:hypothetical protein
MKFIRPDIGETAQEPEQTSIRHQKPPSSAQQDIKVW